MATPITSGNAALLRQYLLEGWYPSGSKGGSNPKVPSGTLMKAMLINSAVTLGGTYQQNSAARTRDALQETLRGDTAGPESRTCPAAPARRSLLIRARDI